MFPVIRLIGNDFEIDITRKPLFICRYIIIYRPIPKNTLPDIYIVMTR